MGARVVQRIVKSAGHEAVLIDFPQAVKRAKTIPRPEALSYLYPFIIDETGPVSFFTAYKRLGPESSQCARMIVETEPDLLLICCFAYAYAQDALSLAAAMHATAPGLTIVAGGAGATVLPEKFLRSGEISFVLAGEAEVNLPCFLEEYVKRDPDYGSIPGFFAHDGLKVVSPAPRRETGESELEWVHSLRRGAAGGRRLTTSLSRGCPRLCAFCSNHLCHGRSFRKTPIERVFKGIDSAAAGAMQEDTQGITRLNFEDDNLFADPEYALAAVDYARLKLGAPAVTAENGLDAAFLQSVLLDRLIDSGLEQLNLSLGSVDPQVLAGAHRTATGAKVAALTSQAAERGVNSVTYFICGLPGDSRQTVTDNLLFLASLDSKIGISLFYPTPGIKGFEDTAGFLDTSPVICCSSSAFPWTRTLPTESLVTAFRLARLINLMKEPAMRSTHRGLLQKILAERRLHTYRKNGGLRSIVPVPRADADLARAVISRLGHTVRC